MLLMALYLLMVHHSKIHDELPRKFLKSFDSTQYIDVRPPLIFSPTPPNDVTGSRPGSPGNLKGNGPIDIDLIRCLRVGSSQAR